MDITTAFFILTTAGSLLGGITVGVIIANLISTWLKSRKEKKQKEMESLIKTLENF